MAAGDEKLSSPSGTCTAKEMTVRDRDVMGPGSKLRLFAVVRVVYEVARVLYRNE